MWIQSQIRWQIDWNQDIRFSHSSHCIPARSLVHIKIQSCAIYEFYLGQRNVLLLQICFSIYIALTDVNVACSSSYTFGDEIMSWVFHVSPFPCPGRQLSHETIQSINQSRSPSPYHMTFKIIYKPISFPEPACLLVSTKTLVLTKRHVGSGNEIVYKQMAAFRTIISNLVYLWSL